jgi:hypothetical protein
MAPTVEQWNALCDALAVTAELTQTELSHAAASVMAQDLSTYPFDQVMIALTRCRRELKSRLTVAAVLERLDDGRPGANEAWAMLPQDERGSIVWSDEMQEAYGACATLLHAGQIIAARSAFIEAYEKAVMWARAEHRPVRWTPTLGHDVGMRAAALEKAVRLGRISEKHAQSLLPSPDRQKANVSLVELARSAPDDRVKAQIVGLKLMLLPGGKR